jgi:hypothetical protein
MTWKFLDGEGRENLLESGLAAEEFLPFGKV